MQFQKEHIQKFHQIKAWKYQEIIRYTWLLHHGDHLTRDLILWLCEYDKFFESTRLKIHAYDVSDSAYTTLYTGWKVDIRVRIGEKMQYAFLDVSDYVDALFECQDFTFTSEDVNYDEL